MDTLRGHAPEKRGPHPAVSQEEGLLEVLGGLLVAELVIGARGLISSDARIRRFPSEAGGGQRNDDR
jgi:hypothetical protein